MYDKRDLLKLLLVFNKYHIKPFRWFLFAARGPRPGWCTDTWLKPSDTLSCLSDPTLPGFSLLHKPRPHGRGGGVGFLISNKFRITYNTIPSFSKFECICLRVSGGSFEGTATFMVNYLVITY